MIAGVYYRVSRLPTGHPLRRVWRYLRRISWVRRIVERLLAAQPGIGISAAVLLPGMATLGSPSTCAHSRPYSTNPKQFFADLLDRACTTSPTLGVVPRRVLLVNAGLAAGGAERQIVNTLNGLSRQNLESVSFLGEYLFESRERAFLMPGLRPGITADQVRKRTCLAENAALIRVDPSVSKLLAALPVELAEEILDLATEFRHRCPEVVHAWQDSTSIKCGIAATLAGVPRIVLGSRNVNPSNFAYHQPYMRPAYQALAERPHVIMTNNSEAGAIDFCRWLDLPREHFRVVRNGVALDDLQCDAEGAKILRDEENIPPDALVVGSIFRFWPEKRPLLWLEIAARLLALRPDTHFLLVGDGPLRKQMSTFLAGVPLADHIHLIPPTNRVGRMLSAMDLFLLTSRFEGTPNVILEAEWLGLPVMAMNAGGVAEAIVPGTNGIVCENDSPEAAVLHLCTMIDDPRWFDRAREVGPSFVRERFGLNRMIRETMDLYGYTPRAPSCPVGNCTGRG